MELRQLRCFVAVAEELHFSRAAERLHMAQPPVSLTIRMLEEELGAKLFERTKRRVALTAAGRTLLEEARAILEHVARTERKVTHVAKGGADRLEIGFLGAATFGDAMSPLLARFHHEWPDVPLMLEQMSTDAQLEALCEGRIDIGFARPPDPDLLPPGIIARCVQHEPLLVALSSDHPLAGSGRIELAALKNEPFVIPTRQLSHGIHDKVRELCAHAGFAPRVVMEVHQLTTVISLAAAGIGVSILGAGVRRAAIPGLAFAEITDEGAFIDLLLLYRDADMRPAVRNFIEIL